LYGGLEILFLGMALIFYLWDGVHYIWNTACNERVGIMEVNLLFVTNGVNSGGVESPIIIIIVVVTTRWLEGSRFDVVTRDFIYVISVENGETFNSPFKFAARNPIRVDQKNGC
jgi:hypothetical protein